MKYKALMLIVLLLVTGCAVSVPTSKGCIIKYVYYDDMPLEGAYVELRCGPSPTKIGCPTGYTGQDGSISFCGLEYGTYYIYVDWNDDGIWDTVDELVILDSPEEIVYNNYYPLEVGDEDCTNEYSKDMIKIQCKRRK